MAGASIPQPSGGIIPTPPSNFYLPPNFPLPQEVVKELEEIAKRTPSEILQNDDQRAIFQGLHNSYKFLFYFSTYLRDAKLKFDRPLDHNIINTWETEKQNASKKLWMKICHIAFPIDNSRNPYSHDLLKHQDEALQLFVPVIDQYVDYKHVEITDGMILKQTFDMLLQESHDCVHRIIMLNGHGDETRGLQVQAMGETDMFYSIISTVNTVAKKQISVVGFVINTFRNGIPCTQEVKIPIELNWNWSMDEIKHYLQGKDIAWSNLQEIIFQDDINRETFPVDLNTITHNTNVKHQSNTEQFISLDEIIKLIERLMHKYHVDCKIELVLGCCFAHTAKYKPVSEGLKVTQYNRLDKPENLFFSNMEFSIHFELTFHMFIEFKDAIQKIINATSAPHTTLDIS